MINLARLLPFWSSLSLIQCLSCCIGVHSLLTLILYISLVLAILLFKVLQCGWAVCVEFCALCGLRTVKMWYVLMTAERLHLLKWMLDIYIIICSSCIMEYVICCHILFKDYCRIHNKITVLSPNLDHMVHYYLLLHLKNTL